MAPLRGTSPGCTSPDWRIPVVSDRIRAAYQGPVKSHVDRIARLLCDSRIDCRRLQRVR